jgi:S-formylglutathione hydrolase FrmB
VLAAGTAVLGAAAIPMAAEAAEAATRLSVRPPAGAVSVNGSRVVKQYWLNARELDLTVKSVGLAMEVKVRVLLPKGWSPGARRTWPIVYALHGGNDHFISWTRSSQLATVAAEWDVMVAMPEGGASGSYTNWYNNGNYGLPEWETFHTEEVPQILQNAYHAGGDRAVLGLSSGGMGAMNYAERHPGLFSYVASYSGFLSTRSPGMPAMLMYVNSGQGFDPFRIWGVPYIDDDNWRQHDPFYMLPNLRGTRTGIYISSGTTGDAGPLDNPNKAPWDIGYISERVVGATNERWLAYADFLGVPVISHLYGDGSHTWPYWNREMKISWPLIMERLGVRHVGKSGLYTPANAHRDQNWDPAGANPSDG